MFVDKTQGGAKWVVLPTGVGVDHIQKPVKDSKDLQPASSRAQKGAKCITIPKTAVGIRQGNGCDLIHLKTGTLEIDDREKTFLIAVNVIIAALWKQYRISGI